MIDPSVKGMATKERKATVTITISVRPDTADLAKRAVASGKYRSVSHFFEQAAYLIAHVEGIK